MKIFLHYADYDEREVNEAEEIVELLKETMKEFSVRNYTISQNAKDSGTHSCFFIHNFKHPEL